MQRNLLSLATALVFALFTSAAGAQSGSVEIKDAWARAMPGGAQTGAAYVTLRSPTGDRLTGASTPVAKMAELHSMTMDNGVMKMRQVEGIDLPAGQPVSLKPNGYHIMLMGVGQPLKEGQTFPLTLTFAKAGSENVSVTVEKVGSMGPGAQGSGMNMPGMSTPMQHH
ncbi:MAG TPA: copper chaperone PCu(A)C [Stellaceae bacterium]|nr:copper chaperone PCu(A)C [Stellaceae bacterium]